MSAGPDAKLMIAVWEQIEWWQANDVSPDDVGRALGIGAEGWMRISAILRDKLAEIRKNPPRPVDWRDLTARIVDELQRPAAVA